MTACAAAMAVVIARPAVRVRSLGKRMSWINDPKCTGLLDQGRVAGRNGRGRKGASGRIRTCGTWYRKPVLYPLSYGGIGPAGPGADPTG